MDWIVKTFRGYIFEDYNQIDLESAISLERLKIFVIKILRIEQNL